MQQLQPQHLVTEMLGNPNMAAIESTNAFVDRTDKALKELIEEFTGCLSIAEEDLNARQIVSAFRAAVQTQIDYYHSRKEMYQSILDELK